LAVVSLSDVAQRAERLSRSGGLAGVPAGFAHAFLGRPHAACLSSTLIPSDANAFTSNHRRSPAMVLPLALAWLLIASINSRSRAFPICAVTSCIFKTSIIF